MFSDGSYEIRDADATASERTVIAGCSFAADRTVSGELRNVLVENFEIQRKTGDSAIFSI